MCGIIGFSGRFEAAALIRGQRAISHRGPDDSGVFLTERGRVGLAHVRLSILDLSPLGHQPMATADGTVVLVFNGEIYNFRELRAELEAKGYRFRGRSDTEVLLSLYLSEGEAMLTRLNGIFAFALWDSRRETIFIARDGFGVKPLYFCESGEGLAFASEIRGLLALAPAVRDLDPVALHRYMSFLWCPGDGTPFKAIRKLQPGGAMIVRDGRVERRWSWYTPPTSCKVDRRLSKETAVKGTVSHLREAVRRQMVADVPIGAFLSGGLDSSAIVALAREERQAISCFTIEAVGGQEEGSTDDLPYARRVAKHLGVALHVVRIDASRMANDLERMVTQLEEPLADPAPLNVLYISRLAREHGIKVLLSGAGGDDIFTGYARHRAIRFDNIFHWLPNCIKCGIENVTAGLDQRRPLSRRIAKLFNGAGLEGDARLANYFLWTKNADLLGLYSRQFRAEVGDAVAVAPLIDFMCSLPENTSPLGRMLALEQRFFLADHNLIYTDKMSMAVGVEVRVPFLDKELVDFAAQVPESLKQRGPVGKWVLKEAMGPYLPDDVIRRTKSGFGAPVRRWMQHELRPMLAELLSPSSLKRRGLFDPRAVEQLIKANDDGRVDSSYTLLSLVCIEIWCRAFVDRHAHAQLLDG